MALTSITQDFVVASGLVVQGTNLATTSSSAAGTLSVRGGAAFAQNVVIGSTASIWGPGILHSTLFVQGNTGIQGALNSTGTFSVNNNLFTVNGATGNLYSQGNAGIQGTLNSTGTLSVNNNLFTVDGATGNIYSQGNAGIQGTLNSTGTLSVNNNLFTVDGATGNVYSAGNAGIQGTLHSTGTLSVNNNLFTVDGATGNVATQGTLAVVGASTLTGALYVGAGTTLNSTLNVAGVTTLTDTTAADSLSGAASLKLSGGEYISKNLVVMGAGSSTGTLTANALYVAGGVGINNGLRVQGTAVFQNDVFFNGQTTYVYSTNTVYTDNLIELHSTSTGVSGVWTFDDQKDIGLRFHYYQNGIGDLNAAFVLAADTHEFEFYRNGTETNGSFVSHDYAGIKAASLNLVGGTSASNTGSGDLVVAGGVGIAGELWVGNTIHGTVTQANNLNGGAQGYIPIQSANGVTAFIPAGTADSQVLTWSGTTATWVSAGSQSVNFANYSGTATNIAGGVRYDIPYQSATSTTTFSSNLQFDGTTLTVTGIKDTALTTNGGVVYNSDGMGTLADSSGLTYDGSGTLTVGTELNISGSGGSITMTGGDITGANNITGSGTVQGGYVDPTNLTSGRVTFHNGSWLVDDANLLYDSGTGTLSVGATDGNGSLYVGYNITVDTSGSVTLNYATQNAIAYIDGSNNLVSNSNLAYDGTNVTLGGSGYVSAPVFEATSTAPTLTTSTGGAVSVAGGVGIAKDLYVGTTGTVAGNLTVQSDLYVDGTLYVKGTSLTGIDKITGSTGTFVDIVSTGTAYLATVTATNTLYVGSTATFNSDVYVDGTLYVQGHSLTGVDKITGSTGTFQDIVSTGTAYLATVTATNTLYVGATSKFNQTATFNSDVFVDGTLYVQGNSLTGVDKITGSTGTFLDIVSTGTAYLQNVSINGTTTATGHIYVTNTDDGTFPGKSVQDASIGTQGSISAAKNIKAGGVISAGDFGGTGSYDSAISNLNGNSPGTGDSGSIDGFYLLNNMQAARTVKVASQASAVVIDTWDKTLYTSAKYLVQIYTSGGIHIEEIMLVQDQTNIYISEYGIIYTTGSALGTFDSDFSGSNIELKFTPAASLTGTIQIVRQSILTSAESYC